MDMGRPVSEVQSQLLQAKMTSPADSNSGRKNIGAGNGKNLDQEVIARATGRNVDNLKPANDPQKMDRNDFLKMLSHQMQNQDPMNPVDQSRYTADMAQFAQLEQLTNLNKKMEHFNKEDFMEKKLIAASFVGKSVITDGNSVTTEKDGQVTDVLFNLPKNASKLKVQLLDAKGNITAEMPMENVNAGPQKITWNGKATDGYSAPKGVYQVQIKAWDAEMKTIPVSTQVAGTVDSVYFDNDDPVLLVDGKKIYLRDVQSFHQSAQDIQAFQEKMQLMNEAKKLQMQASLPKSSPGINPSVVGSDVSMIPSDAAGKSSANTQISKAIQDYQKMQPDVAPVANPVSNRSIYE